MSVTQWYIIKSITIPSSWVAILASLVFVWLIVWKRYGRQAENLYSDAALLFIVVWKLSVIVTDFGLVMEYPMMILYFNGGQTGFYLGLAAAIIRIYAEMIKNGCSVKVSEVALFSILLIQCFYQILMVFLNQGTNWQGLLTILIFFVMGAAVLNYISKGATWRFQLSVLSVLVMFLAGSFQPAGILQTPILAMLVCVSAFLPVLIVQLKQNRQSEERI